MKKIWNVSFEEGQTERITRFRRSSGKTLFRAVMSICAALLFLPGRLSGGEKTERKVVRVAYSEARRQMNVDEHNNPVSGYVYDYIQTIGTYAGWNVKYVPCGSFADCVKQLLAGEADLFYDISYSGERAKLVLFPDEPMGVEYYYLYASDQNTSIVQGDFTSLNGKTAGVTGGTLMTELLKQWCKKKNVTLRIVEYNDIEAKEADLQTGKIDLALEISMVAKPGFSAIEKIGSSAFYLVANRERPDLIDDINSAAEKILNNDLYYFMRLQERYFSETVLSRNLTAEEKNWLADHKVLRVGYLDNYLPFSDRDKNGNPIGAGIDAIHSIIRQLKLEDKLNVEFICYDDQHEGYRAVETGQIDLMFPACIGNSVKKDYRLIGGKVFASLACDLAYSGEYWETRNRRFGVNRNNLMQYYYCRDFYPDSEIVFYDDIRSCFDGLLNGTSDGTFLNGIRSDGLLKSDKYRSIKTIRARYDFEFQMAFAEDNIGLMLLMDRGLTMLGHDFVNKAAYSYLGRFYTFSMMDFLREHILGAIITIAFLAALIVALIGFRISNRKLTRYNIRLKKERERSIRAEKARSYFFSTVSHDIRTPLNAIIGFSEMLRMGIHDGMERGKALNAIITSSKSLLDLINDMLDFSKLESGRMEFYPVPTDVEKLVKELTAPFKAAASTVSVQVRTEVGEMPFLKLDPQRTRRILFNLVDNAVKFTQQGFVAVRASFEPAPDPGRGTLRFEVEDTGCGIGEEDLKRITSPYVQVDSKEARHGGTGVGLAVCRKLVDAMGGALAIASERGKGSTFTVTLRNVEVSDAAPEEESAAADISRSEPAADGKEEASAPKRILIADDQQMNLTVLKTMLKKLGTFDVVMAKDGQEALGILRSSDTPFDLVLTDMWMPVMDGEGLVRAIRADEKLASIPVHVVTADTEMQGRYRETGFDGILLKPVTAAKLKALLG